MSRRNNRPQRTNLKSNTKSTGVTNKLYPQLVDKTISQTRQDIAKWKSALTSATNADNPSVYALYNLYDYIMDDAHLTSQIENRMQDTLGSSFQLKKKGGDTDDELTEQWQNSRLFNDIITQILESRFKGYTLIEFDWEQIGQNEPELICNLLPRQNVLPTKGTFLKDYSEQSGVQYRDLQEFGTWILDFGKPKDIGLLNKAIPHILFKRFGQSCWSELCEIYGIPPRVYKTDAQDPSAVARGKRMMQDMGSAAWFIIDTSEEFEWAKGVSTNGDVYQNLLTFCDNQNSMLISGAIIGQDTKNGSRSKDEASQKMLDKLVLADMAMVEMYMNTKVMPALARIGVVPGDYAFAWEISEDLAELWGRVVQALPYYNIKSEWIKDKFGIEVEGPRTTNAVDPNIQLKALEGLFI